MKALDGYRDIQHELDKYSTPTFEVEQFNHFFNFAIDEYLANNYARYPLIQKDIDDIRMLVKTVLTPLAITSNVVTVPEDYRHMLRVQVNGTFNKNVGKYKSGDTKLFKNLERRFSNEEGYREDNAYLRASYKAPYYEQEANLVRFDFGPDVDLQTVIFQYIITPPIIFLSPTSSDDFNLEANNTTIPFPIHVYRELVNLCARKFLENIQSARYSTKLNEERLRVQ